MAPRLRYALAVLALLPLAMSALTLWGATVYYNREHAGQQRQAAQVAAAQKKQAAAEQAAQRAVSAAFERRLCATLLPLEGLAKLRPPAGDPVANPSRAFEQQLVQKLAPLAELGPDVGCK